MIIKGINTLILAVGDSAINVAQHFILGMSMDSTAVVLSPENIFSNRIAFVRADFIQMGQTYESTLDEREEQQGEISNEEHVNNILEFIEKDMEINSDRWAASADDPDDDASVERKKAEDLQHLKDYFQTDYPNKIEEMMTGLAQVVASYSNDGGITDISTLEQRKRDKIKTIYAKSDDDEAENKYKKADFTTDQWSSITYAVNREIRDDVLGNLENKSLGEELRGTISKWYYILRNVSLIAMLSVLVYIGIRIVISSVAEEKSKYKNMLMDWLVGICLLFTLHIIMAFISGIIGNITSGIASLANLNDNQENLMTITKRLAYHQNNIGYSFIYCVLIFMTFIYLVYYIKRAINLAFLTLIAPLVALAYPIDKITDQKAQSFDMWLKDYIFYTLIQPVHLLLYVVFVSSSIDLAKNNILYALVVLWFIKSAEEIVRKLFGFDSKAPNVGGPGGLASVGMTAHAIKDMSKILLGSNLNRGNENNSGGQSSGDSNGETIREKNGPSGLSGFGNDNNDNDDDNSQNTGRDNYDGNEVENDESTPGIDGQDDDVDEVNYYDNSQNAESDNNDSNEEENDDGVSDIDGQNNDENEENGDESYLDTEGLRRDDNGRNNYGNSTKKSRVIKGIGKGAKYGLKGTLTFAKIGAKALGVGTGAILGAAYGIASGRDVMKNMATGVAVGAEVTNIGANAFSGVVSSGKNTVSTIRGKTSQKYDLNKQYKDFVNNKQNIEKFKKEYGEDYKTRMEDARQYVNAGYTNFNDIKKGFKIQKRNGFNQEQAINIMELDKNIGDKILSKEQSEKYKDRIMQIAGDEDGNKVISALEDIQTGFLGDGPASERNRNNNRSSVNRRRNSNRNSGNRGRDNNTNSGNRTENEAENEAENN